MTVRPDEAAMHDSRRVRVMRFATAVVAIALLWLWVLPRAGQHPGIREHIRRNQALGINPAAMFYTEVGEVRGVRVRRGGDHPLVESIPIGSGH